MTPTILFGAVLLLAVGLYWKSRKSRRTLGLSILSLLTGLLLIVAVSGGGASLVGADGVGSAENETTVEGEIQFTAEAADESLISGEHGLLNITVSQESSVALDEHPAAVRELVQEAESVSIWISDTYTTEIDVVSDDQELGTIGPDSAKNATFELDVPADLDPGQYLLEVTIAYTETSQVTYSSDESGELNITQSTDSVRDTDDITIVVAEPEGPWTPPVVVWYLLAFVPGLIVTAWLGGKRNTSIERFLNRLSRLLFARFVSPSPGRERRLEAAYISTTYPTYAAKTLLFTLLAFIAGLITGAYIIAGVMTVMEPLVRTLSGLPDTITHPIGIRHDYTFDITHRTRWIVLVLGGIAIGILTAVLSYVLRWQLPASDAAVRAQGIEEGLPRTTAFMFALSRGGMEFPQILRTLARNREVYGETAKEMNVAVREMDMFGRDMITALRRMSRRTPSEQFKTFSENMTSILQSGSDLSVFFREQYERFRDEQEQRQEEVLELLATIAEMYVTVLVAGMLFLITILLVFGLLVADTFMLLVLLIYIMIPLGNAAFALILQQKLDELGIAKKSGAKYLQHLDPTTPVNDSPQLSQTQPDGGIASAHEQENRRMLTLYDKMSRFKRFMRNPLRTFLRNPTRVLWVTVPIALLVLFVRMPAAFQAEGIAYRVLDDLLIQSALFVLITYAVVREYYKRRINKIEAATPELLERLASLNEAGMSVVEGFERLRGSDLGVLTPEIERIWRDIEYGSNVDDSLVRFGRRVRTIAVTRVVTLLTNAMRASGDMGPVLRVAAEQARAEVKLRRKRQQQMMTYLVVIYVSFFVFLVIVVAVNEVLIPSLPETVPTPDSDDVSRLPGGADQFSQLGEVNKAAYSLIFFHGAMIQAACAGFIAGQLGEGSLRDGAKHAAIMVTIAYIAFILLTSPVASITVTDTTYDGEVVHGVEEVSLSDGGFIAIYDDEGVDGELLGSTGYLTPGTHSDLQIPLQYGNIEEDTTIRIVAHRDTNDNEQFDFRPPHRPGENQVDRPYEALGEGDQPGVEVELTIDTSSDE